MGFLSGKKLLITGVLSNRSIAYGIAKACHAQGAELAFSYVGERFKDRITEFAADFDSKLVFDCDVGDDAQIDKLFARPSATWPKFDGFVHGIGFAPREAIAGDFLDGLSREASASRTTSAPTASRRWPRRPCPTERQVGPADPDLPGRDARRPQLQHHGPGQGLAGSLGALPGRVARARRASASTASAPARSRRWRPAASRTSARSCRWWPRPSPIRRNVTIEDVGNVAAFLLSDLAGGVTAEITYVDGGFSQTAIAVEASWNRVTPAQAGGPASGRRRAPRRPCNAAAVPACANDDYLPPPLPLSFTQSAK